MADRPSKPDLAERAFRRRRRQDVALMLPILGIVLLASPIAAIFLGGGLVFGLPVPILYIFGVWIFLILLARRMARHLSDDEPGS
jgi:fatty acid desaturase